MSILMCIGIIRPALCQNVYYRYAAPHVFSANAGGNFSNALNAAFNPSLLPFICSLEAGLHAEKKYGTDINTLLITVCAPFDGSGISVTMHRYGNALFNESTFGVCYGKKIGAVNAGIMVERISIKIRDAKSESLINAGVASSVEIAENVFVSCRVSNPRLFAQTGLNKLHAASLFSLSLGFAASPEVYAAMESLKEEGRPLSLIFSLYYTLAEKFSCKMNWSTFTNQPFVSVSWQPKILTIEAGCSYHPVLGASPTISFMYKKPAKK